MIFKSGELKHLGVFYLSTFIYSVSAVIFPFYILFFRGLELSFFQIALTTGAFFALQFLFEVPTGAFADSYSRKFSVLIGLFFSAVIVFFMGFAQTFWEIFVIWALLGFFSTFISGAQEGWVIGNLNKKKRKDLHQEFFIKLQVISAAGFIAAPLLGSLIVAQEGMGFLWTVFAAGFLVCGLVLLFAPEHYRPVNASISKALHNNLSLAKKGFRVVLKKKQLLYLMLGGLFYIFMSIGEEAWQPYLVGLSLPVEGLGYVYAALALLSTIAAFSPRYLKRFPIGKTLVWTELLCALFFAAVFFIVPPLYMLALIPFLLTSSIWVATQPLKETFLHKHTPESFRATVVSIKSMVDSIAIIVLMLLGGALMDALPLRYVIALGAVFVVGAVYFYSKLKD